MRRSLTLRRTLAALATPLLLVGLGACGSDPEEDASEPTTSSESEPAEDAQGGEEVDSAEFLDLMETAIDGATTAGMSMTMDMGQGAIQADGEADYTTTPLTMAMTMAMPGMADPMELRLVDGVMYMNMGQLSNGKFISYDLEDPAGLPPGMEGLNDQLDPLAQFPDFEDALESVTYQGGEDVDGEQLERYTVAVDSSKIGALQDLPDQASVPSEIVYDIWFDGEGLMRQMVTELDVAGTTASTEVKLFDWGTPVRVEAPPAAEVVQAPGS